MKNPPIELPGLEVVLDNLVHHFDAERYPAETPHAFIYFLTIRNLSDRKVKLLGRKWVIEHENGETVVVEGDKIVGHTPLLAPGEEFSYNSFHLTGTDCRARGSFHGLDEFENRVFVKIPPFTMKIPT